MNIGSLEQIHQPTTTSNTHNIDYFYIDVLFWFLNSVNNIERVVYRIYIPMGNV